jgi:hypothetical protein
MLDDNVFCNVARGLGAVCTIVFLERADIIDAELVQTTNGDNLVVINNGDYILNWDKDSVRNKCSPFVVDRRLTQTQIKIKYL